MVNFIKKAVISEYDIVLLILSFQDAKKIHLKRRMSSNQLQYLQIDMLAMTPPMGWNSWNPFGKNVSEAGNKGNSRCICQFRFERSGIHLHCY